MCVCNFDQVTSKKEGGLARAYTSVNNGASHFKAFLSQQAEPLFA